MAFHKSSKRTVKGSTRSRGAGNSKSPRLSASYDPADLERFRKILGLLGSAHDGERAAAARKASEFLASHGLTWSSVSLPVEQPDVLAPRRGKWMNQRAEREMKEAMSEFEKAIQAEKAAKAARKAAWRERSYGADADGFEPGRK